MIDSAQPRRTYPVTMTSGGLLRRESTETILSLLVLLNHPGIRFELRFSDRGAALIVCCRGHSLLDCNNR